MRPHLYYGMTVYPTLFLGLILCRKTIDIDMVVVKTMKAKKAKLHTNREVSAVSDVNIVSVCIEKLRPKTYQW